MTDRVPPPPDRVPLLRDRVPPLRVALEQFRPKKGRVRENLAALGARIRAASGSCDLLIFPEAVTTGYFLEGGTFDLALRAGVLAESLPSPAADAPDVVLGFYERADDDLHNSVVWLTPEAGAWRVVHVHRKLFLPTYTLFDEGRFLRPGLELRAFDTRWGRVGMLVCEDIWHSLTSTILALDGADLIVSVSASPARGYRPGSGGPENMLRWEQLASSIAAEHGVFFVVANLIGSEGGKIFGGGSVLADPEGRILARAPWFEEGRVDVALDPEAIGRTRSRAPLLADLRGMLPHLRRALDRATGSTGEGRIHSTPGLAGASAAYGGVGAAGASIRPGTAGEKGSPAGDPGSGRFPGSAGAEDGAASLQGAPQPSGVGGGRSPWAPHPGDRSPLEVDADLLARVLIHFLREEVQRRRGMDRVVVGVSGGVDSAVTLLLARAAFGPDQVLALQLPYATSSPESLEHAALLLEGTGIPSRIIDITPSVDAMIAGLDPEMSPLRRGNLAARTRAMALFDQSAAIGGIPLGTGNKSERLLGYFTWHADDSPPVNPLGDLFKTQVWALARHLGVPAPILEKPPSADLVRGIHDEDELGIDYLRADLILHWLLRGYRTDELVDAGFPAEDVERVSTRLEATHWKRKTPTVAVLSDTAVGEFWLRPVDY